MSSRLERILVDIAAPLAPVDGAVDVIVVDDEFIRNLNREFRGVDKPTDVISFSYRDESPAVAEDDLVGEVYVSHETLEKEARKQGIDREHLFLRLGVHGMLHVLGRTHDGEAEATRMENEERDLLTPHLGEAELTALFNYDPDTMNEN